MTNKTTTLSVSNTEIIQQINQLKRKLGELCAQLSIKYLQEAFHLTPLKISSSEINVIIRKYFPTQKISHLDGKYWLLPWWQWQDLINVDWVSTKKWVAEKFDCDNFANAFASNMAMYYEINSAMRVYGKLYEGTEKFLDYHYWNGIITSNKEIYFLEPQSDLWTKYEGGMLLIGGNKYEVTQFILG